MELPDEAEAEAEWKVSRGSFVLMPTISGQDLGRDFTLTMM
ncbi:unnamed protein product [Lathyrus oleraceus]